MSGLIGKKIGMTSIFDQAGKNIPCTVLEVGPCTVLQLKTKDKEGYEAVQLGFEDKKEARATKAEIAHAQKAKTAPKKEIREFIGFEQALKQGDIITVSDVFEEGQYVDVTSYSKGKGFQGVVRRHGFGGVGQSTHGQHNRLRAPGSVGASSYPSRVFKGLRMAGRMGNQKTTVQNLIVTKIIPEKNLLLLKGAVPGHKNGYVIIRK